MSPIELIMSLRCIIFIIRNYVQATLHRDDILCSPQDPRESVSFLTPIVQYVHGTNKKVCRIILIPKYCGIGKFWDHE